MTVRAVGRVGDPCRYCPTVKARHLVRLPGRHRHGYASAVCDACLARLVPPPEPSTVKGPAS